MDCDTGSEIADNEGVSNGTAREIGVLLYAAFDDVRGNNVPGGIVDWNARQPLYGPSGTRPKNPAS